jgi:hypothetical protein
MSTVKTADALIGIDELVGVEHEPCKARLAPTDRAPRASASLKVLGLQSLEPLG